MNLRQDSGNRGGPTDRLSRPHLISFQISTGATLQAKHRRYLLGRLRPNRCGHCRQFTNQIGVEFKDVPKQVKGTWMYVKEVVRRQCLSCKSSW